MQLHSTIDSNDKSTISVTDSELVARVRKGNIDAFEIIMRRHNQRLYRIARSILKDENEALDVVQETYIKAYYKLDQFKGPEGFVSWLSRIASNEAIMRIRKSKSIDYNSDELENKYFSLESSDPLPIDELAIQQLRKLLEDAIDKLPLSYRNVYVMRAVQQLSTLETAKILEISEDVVKTRYLRAKRSLQKIFDVHLNKAGLDVFEFAGKRCDATVKAVLMKLKLD